MNITANPDNLGSDVKLIEYDNRKIYLVGTAHVSKESVDTVRNTIEQVKPDTVCIELDEKRHKALSDKKKWESLNLKEVIKNKQLSTLIINILLASYQKKIGEQLGVAPGSELLEADKVAKENNINISLVDRDIRITLRRAWNSMGFWQKMKFVTVGLAGLFEKEDISEEQLREIRQKDALSEMLKELGKTMPVLKTVLIDERDTYLAKKIEQSQGDTIVAVVGAGHVEGMLEHWGQDTDLDAIEIIPKSSPVIKIIGWGIPAIIVASLMYIGISKGVLEAGDNLLFWILVNGIPSGIGAILALGHPLTIIGTFLAAPFTSLTPVIGAGYVAAFIQVYFKPPQVLEFQTVTDDFGHFTKWWSNKLLRILLVFILTSLGSALGTYVGAYEIISNIF